MFAIIKQRQTKHFQPLKKEFQTNFGTTTPQKRVPKRTFKKLERSKNTQNAQNQKTLNNSPKLTFRTLEGKTPTATCLYFSRVLFCEEETGQEVAAQSEQKRPEIATRSAAIVFFYFNVFDARFAGFVLKKYGFIIFRLDSVVQEMDIIV